MSESEIPVAYERYQLARYGVGMRTGDLTLENMGDTSDIEMPRLVQTAHQLFVKQAMDVPADDVRLTHIWEQAAEIANRKGYCGIFDEIMDELGTGYTRETEFCVTVTRTITLDVHVTAPRDSMSSDLVSIIEDCDLLDSATEVDSDWEITNYEIADS